MATAYAVEVIRGGRTVHRQYTTDEDVASRWAMNGFDVSEATGPRRPEIEDGETRDGLNAGLGDVVHGI